MEEKCTGILSVWNNKIKKEGQKKKKAWSIERNSGNVAAWETWKVNYQYNNVL